MIRPIGWALASLLVGAWLVPTPAGAQACDNWQAIVVSVQGRVESRRSGQTQWRPATQAERLCPGDAIRVQERSRAGLVLRDEALLRLDQNTTVTFTGPPDQPGSWVEMLRGAVHFISRVPRGLKVLTPFVNGTVEGTEFWVQVTGDQTILAVVDGRVSAENVSGRVTVQGGQLAVARAGQAPARAAIAHPRDGVQWALHYPAVAHRRAAQFPDVPGETWPAGLRRSLERWAAGDLDGAFGALAQVAPDIRDPRVPTYRAELLLAVGRVDEARVELARALSGDPRHGAALALQSVIAVVQNDRPGALRLARQAVDSDPGSSSSWVALSYAQQASFDLDSALASLQQATRRDPGDALAWARLSELWLSFGRSREAAEAAHTAARLQPTLARTETVLGFARLAEGRFAEGRAAFERAIRLDQADPWPRLGLGLARIRDGALEAGRRELAIATLLDPGSSLLRSYLGKAYYEEKREGLDEREYAVAKRLDPNDPTPYFYDAIAKQTTNRPVEAMQEMQRALERNDNRAVYRSRLLLDADAAARSAAQARIYGDLGFPTLALVEGWKSVSADPANSSAHRLLADSYAARPRTDITRVSELLQSQLLQPLNATALQPTLAETSLLLVGGGGPASLSFNEFNPMFNRAGVTFQASGLAGENATWGGESVLAGIFRNVSFSLGSTRFDSQGWRANAFQKDRIANAFAQLDLSPATSVQLEYRHRNVQTGDLALEFFKDVGRDLRQSTESSTYRGGLRHGLSPGSLLLASVIYQESISDLRFIDPVPNVGTLFTDLASSARALSSELQYLYRSSPVNLVAGAGHADVNARTTVDSTFVVGPPSPPLVIPFDIPPLDEDARHTNLYLYAHINALRGLTLTLGASIDFFETDSPVSESRDQFNPKVGVTWNPLPGTTLRAAVLRVLRRTLVTGQTLEPTTVAGFDQFLDDAAGTDSWRYGGGVDQKLTEDLFGGIEFSKRTLTVPIRLLDGIERLKGVEHLGGGYLYWAPRPWVAASAEYTYERLSNDEILAFAAGFEKVVTHRLPLGLRFFHPSGLHVSVKQTWVHQSGAFVPSDFSTPRSGRERFWLTDVTLGYRLPRRYGFVTVGATNLFDKNFRYQDTDLASFGNVRQIRNLSIQPDRFFFVRATIALP